MSTELRRLGKYELHKRLAHGGMGEVWKARDTQLGRYVAIKLLRADLRHNPDFVARFEREAQLIAALRHPNIVQIHDFQVASLSAEDDDTIAYMVMDYVEGQTLADYLRSTSRRGQFPPASDILYLFTGISLALDYAHRQGMVHRDIKPANILLDQRLSTAKPMGEPVLTDFGIARLQGAASQTMIGSVVGTPLYISPEQAQGQHGDQRSDLYSLGVILYEMVTGVTPFRGAPLAILMQHLQDMPTPPALINPHISAELSAVILKSLAKKPEDRFSSAGELTRAIATAMHLPPPARLAPPPASHLPLGGNAYRDHSSPPTHTASLQVDLQQPVAGLHGQEGNARPPQRAVTTPLLIVTPSQVSLPAVPRQPAPVNPPTTPRRYRGRKIRLIAFLILMLLLSLGLSGILLHTNAQQPPPSVASSGQVHFSQSANAPNSTYDELQITIDNVANPPAGRVYYAWIETPANESVIPHWTLSMDGNAIRTDKLTYQQMNLLQPQGMLLITAEESDMAPYVPTGPRVYYARVQPGGSLTFEIMSCAVDTITCVV